jgi:hypothetical protein
VTVLVSPFLERAVNSGAGRVIEFGKQFFDIDALGRIAYVGGRPDGFCQRPKIVCRTRGERDLDAFAGDRPCQCGAQPRARSDDQSVLEAFVHQASPKPIPCMEFLP